MTLIIGGARSGKSRRAQQLAETSGAKLIFVATAEPFDDEMATRIAHHRGDRGDRWVTVEAPVDLPGALRRHAAPDTVLLLDCITVWLSNLMHHGLDVAKAADALLAALGQTAGNTVVVTNEVGLAIVPETPLARQFRDEAGRINQRLAAVADRVELVVAGLTIRLK